MDALTRPRQSGVLLRNACESIALLGKVFGLALIDLTTLSAITQGSPLAITLGAVLFLDERVDGVQWGVLGLGFLFVLLIIRPGGGWDPNALFAMAAMLGQSGRDLVTRPIKASVTSLQLCFYGYLNMVLLGLGVIVSSGEASPGREAILPATGMVLFSAAGSLAVTEACRTTEVSVVAPFRYTRLPFAALVGSVAFGERPDVQTVIGAAGTILCGLYLLRRKRSPAGSAAPAQ